MAAESVRVYDRVSTHIAAFSIRTIALTGLLFFVQVIIYRKTQGSMNAGAAIAGPPFIQSSRWFHLIGSTDAMN